MDLEGLNKELEEYSENIYENTNNTKEENVDLDQLLSNTNFEELKKQDIKQEDDSKDDLSSMLDEYVEEQNKSRHL